MAYSKRKSKKASEDQAEAPVSETVTSQEHSHADLESKIASLESKVEALEGKLAKVLASIEALAQVKKDLDEVKAKLGSEVKELRENAKSWVTKQKEAIDTNQDGKIDFEEIYEYVKWRTFGKTHAWSLRRSNKVKK
tara:strand:+ start:311 stop:721 length:411 start_codon:yes stop_codon:yes gene_type:complete